MLPIAMPLLWYLQALLLPRHNLALELPPSASNWRSSNANSRDPQCVLDRLFWIVLRRFWPSWSGALILVKPETVLSWHRAGFEWFWQWRSRPRRRGGPRLAARFAS
jgi:hypothetical protein